MVLELHVWGPAFSLPSIDAQCLATIAYFTQAVPKGEWVLIPSSDPGLSPTKELPALRNGSIWIGGFRNILDYLRQYSSGQWDLDSDLEQHEKADCIAFSSFVEAHGQPLVDLSLYVSSQNYVSSTRPACSSILQWPNQWIIPPKRRATAKTRTQHLGISSLDVDTASGASERSNNIPGSEHIPESLVRRSEETVTSILSQPHRQSRIRLDALTRNFLEPLQDLLGKQSFFFSDEQPTSLDCLTLGYLALALYPDLPQPWLADIMREGFESLCAYVHNLRGSFFGGPVRIEDALSTRDGPAGADEAEAERNKRAKGKGPLPWLAPERGGLTTIGSLLLSNILDSIPLIDQLRASNRLTLAANESNLTEQEKAQVQAIATARRRELFSQVITVGAGISAFVGYLFYTGIVSLPGEEEEMVAGEKRGLADLGEAGAMLAMADYMDGRSQKGNTSEHHPVVEVDVEVDGERAM